MRIVIFNLFDMIEKKPKGYLMKPQTNEKDFFRNPSEDSVSKSMTNSLTDSGLTPESNDGERIALPPLPEYVMPYCEEGVDKQQSSQATVENPFNPGDTIILDEYRKKLASGLVASNTMVPESKPIIEIDGHGILRKSDIHLVKAKAKAGKTTLLKIMVSAMLCGDDFNMLKIKSLLDNPTIVWFDTEQSMDDTHRIIMDVIKMSGKSPEYVNEHVKAFHLRRSFCDELKAMLVTALTDYRPDVLIVDGVVDMVLSFNDEQESRQFVRTMISLSEEYDCSIIQVLHTNKLKDDHNPRGHLGTCETNASETVLECEKKDKIFTVKCTDSRHSGEDMPNLHFMYDDNGNIIDADEQYMTKEKARKSQQASKSEYYLKLAQEIVREQGEPANRTELSKKMAEKTGKAQQTMANVITSLDGKGLYLKDKEVWLSSRNA